MAMNTTEQMAAALNSQTAKKETASQHTTTVNGNTTNTPIVDDEIAATTLMTYMRGTDKECSEIKGFYDFLQNAEATGIYTFEAAHLHKQTTEATIQRNTGETIHLINLSNYNYLGYGSHPEVIQAAKDALDQYGLGAASPPTISGTFNLHRQLEEALIKFFDLPDHGISLFTSGYGVNVGTISAIMKPSTHIILDKGAHMSILEGAQLSRAKIHFFDHNDMQDLEKVLNRIGETDKRVLICTEGVYSADGDKGNLKEIVRLAKKYEAYTLVDEAHSALLGGENGRGISEEQGVLADVDFYVMTFSKSFSAVGGALLAKKEVTRYVNWFARCRMFSCALDPAVTGGILKTIELASTPDGANRRKRIKENAAYMRNLLVGKVDVLNTNSWIIPVIYGDEKLTLPINDYLQRHGLDAGVMTFPAAPKNGARIRLFITSEHTKEQLKRASEIILDAAKKFGFLLDDAKN